jgi:O-antigen/teichoic acid export membrane protein
MLGRSLYITAAKLTGYAIRLALPIVLVRLLTKADFGAYRQFFLLETLIATIFQFGVNQALFYFIPRDRHNAGSYFLNSLFLNISIFGVVFSAIFFVREPLSAKLQMPVLADQFWQIALYAIMLMLTVSTDCFLLAQQRIRASAFFEIGGQVLVSVVTVLVALAQPRLDLILGAIAITRATQFVAMLAYVQFRLRGFRASRYFFGIWPQVRYGLVLGLAGALHTVLLRLHELVVSSRFGPEVFAVYSAGCTNLPFLQYYVYGIVMVSLGRFAELVRDEDYEGVKRLWRQVVVGALAAAVPITLFLLAVAEPLIIVMFTERYREAVDIFRVNVVVQFALVWNATLVLRAMGRNDINVYVNLIALSLALPLLLLGIHLFGPVGAIAAGVALVLFVRLCSLFWLNRISGLRLEYLVGPNALIGFYVDAWRRVALRLQRWRDRKVKR